MSRMAWLVLGIVLATGQPPESVHVREVEVVRVVDADTFDVRPVETTRVRLVNADAWESRRSQRAGTERISDEEIALGKFAAEQVSELLVGKRVWVESRGRADGGFGREGVRMILWDGRHQTDVGLWLREHGHVRSH